MRLLNHTHEIPAGNLALDEALLESPGGETLRFWESDQTFVVLGRSSQIAEEVNLSACREAGVPVLRRVTGGATIVTGPGCLMYAVTLDLDQRPELRAIDRAHEFVLETIVAGLQPHLPEVAYAGTSDLILKNTNPLKKFSGNSVRMKQHRLLYHGTLLYDFNLNQIAKLLREPPRQPDYRDRRPHESFVANLPLDRATIETALIEAWQAKEVTQPYDKSLVESLIAEKYSQTAWNQSR